MLKYDTPIKRKTNRAKKKARKELAKYIILLFAIVFLGLTIIGNQNAETVRDTDILNQQNTILLELDKQSIDDTEENGSQVKLEVLTPAERELVERVVSAEARGEDLIGQEAVAQVIRDRSTAWSMTVTEVLTAESQFASPYEGEISDSVKLAVANVFDGNVSVLEYPTTHFYSGAEPYWADEKIDRGGIGCHKFLY